MFNRTWGVGAVVSLLILSGMDSFAWAQFENLRVGASRAYVSSNFSGRGSVENSLSRFNIDAYGLQAPSYDSNEASAARQNLFSSGAGRRTNNPYASMQGRVGLYFNRNAQLLGGARSWRYRTSLLGENYGPSLDLPSAKLWEGAREPNPYIGMVELDSAAGYFERPVPQSAARDRDIPVHHVYTSLFNRTGGSARLWGVAERTVSNEAVAREDSQAVNHTEQVRLFIHQQIDAAKQRLAAGDTYVAQAMYESVLQIVPDNRDARLGLATCHVLSNRFVTATRHIRAVFMATPQLWLQPADIRSFLGAGGQQLLASEAEPSRRVAREEIRRLRTMLEKSDGSADIHTHLPEVYVSLAFLSWLDGDMDTVRSALNTAANWRPNDGFLMKMGRWMSAGV